MSTDAELLCRYAKDRDERAFAELVQRHLGLVYGAALRRTGGRHVLAEEIAQKVFTNLARQAAQLTGHPTITGWLYRSTRYVAIDAIRIEQRREKLAHILNTMSDATLPAESPADWEQLRPVIDAAMDQLKERDREIMLLRFFQGLTFAEVGAKLNLSENAARMRAERALEKLRFHLGKRGIASTAALAGLLTGQSLVAAPASLAASVTTAALTAVPAGAVATFLTTVLMNKIAVTAITAAAAAAMTTVVWAATTANISESDLIALRAENVRLTQATSDEASSIAVTAIADEFAVQANTIVQTIERRLEQRNLAGLGRHDNHGQATPYEAFLSYGWAMDTGEVAALAKLTTYSSKGLESIRAIHAGMPASIRAQYPTPEELIAFFFVADTLLTPVPGADVVERYVVTETGPGRATLHLPVHKSGLDFVQTPDGWKCVVPDRYPEVLSKRILGNEMLASLGIN